MTAIVRDRHREAAQRAWQDWQANEATAQSAIARAIAEAETLVHEACCRAIEDAAKRQRADSESLLRAHRPDAALRALVKAEALDGTVAALRTLRYLGEL